MMRDPNRINDVLAEVRRVWGKYPDMRLGQLIADAASFAAADRMRTDAGLARHVVMLEDDAIIAGLIELEKRSDRAMS